MEDRYRHRFGDTLFTSRHRHHWLNHAFAKSYFQPALRGQTERQIHPVYLKSGDVFGKPTRQPGRTNLDSFVEGRTVVACWAPLHPEATPHLTRHSHRSWLDEIGVPSALADERMGHLDTTIPGTYKHPTEKGRKRLREDLEELWEESLDERLRWSGGSLVVPLDRALKERKAGR